MARVARGGRKTITPETGISGSFGDTEYKEQGAGYDGPQPPRGLYPAKLSSVGAHTSSDTSIVWTFDVTDGKYAGWRGWVYSDMDNSKWKTQNILVALGVIEPGGEVNKTYEQIMKDAEPCRIQVIMEDYQEELRSKVKNVLAAGTASADTEDNEEEEDEDFDDKKKPAPKPSARRSRATKDPEPEPEDDEDEDGDEREAREAELAELSAAEVKKAAKEAGLTLKDYRGKEPGEIIELILEKEFPEDEDEKGEEFDLDALEEELEDMSLADLKKKGKEFTLTLKDMKDLDEEELIDLILEKAEEQNPSF